MKGRMDKWLHNWTLMRGLRLVLGIFIAIQAIVAWDLLSGLIAVFLLFQAITNTGCCGSGACASPRQPGDPANAGEISYQEVK